MRYLRHPGAALLFLAFIVHTCVPIAAHSARGRIDAMAFRSLDCREFYRLAVNIAQHGSFSQGDPAGVTPRVPDTWRTPGYPLFLAVFVLTLGASPAALVIVQQFLGVLCVWLLYRIARYSMSARRAALVAGVFLLAPYRLQYSMWLMSTTLFTTVLLLIWLTWRRATDLHSPPMTGGRGGRVMSSTDRIPPLGNRWGWYALAGALTGLAILVRPVAILVPIALLIGTMVCGLRRGVADILFRQSWRTPVAFGLSCVLVVGSWMIRNLAVAGHFSLSDQGGVVLAYFKATEAVLWGEGRTADRYLETSLDPSRADQPHRVWDSIDKQLRTRFNRLGEADRASLRWANLAQGNKTSVDSFEVSRALARIGWSYLAEKPFSTTACYLVRCGSILTFPLNLVFHPARGRASRPLRSVALAAPYVLLCLAVLVRLARGGLQFNDVFFPLSCTTALLLATTPQIDPRFRVPMIPFLVFVAFLPKAGHARNPKDARETHRSHGVRV